jgi:hypothetical protein
MNSAPTLHLYPDLHQPVADPNLRVGKNYDARVCALRQRNRNNFIMFLTQGKYHNQR